MISYADNQGVPSSFGPLLQYSAVGRKIYGHQGRFWKLNHRDAEHDQPPKTFFISTYIIHLQDYPYLLHYYMFHLVHIWISGLWVVLTCQHRQFWHGLIRFVFCLCIVFYIPWFRWGIEKVAPSEPREVPPIDWIGGWWCNTVKITAQQCVYIWNAVVRISDIAIGSIGRHASCQCGQVGPSLKPGSCMGNFMTNCKWLLASATKILRHECEFRFRQKMIQSLYYYLYIIAVMKICCIIIVSRSIPYVSRVKLVCPLGGVELPMIRNLQIVVTRTVDLATADDSHVSLLYSLT